MNMDNNTKSEFKNLPDFVSSLILEPAFDANFEVFMNSLIRVWTKDLKDIDSYNEIIQYLNVAINASHKDFMPLICEYENTYKSK